MDTNMSDDEDDLIKLVDYEQYRFGCFTRRQLVPCDDDIVTIKDSDEEDDPIILFDGQRRGPGCRAIQQQGYDRPDSIPSNQSQSLVPKQDFLLSNAFFNIKRNVILLNECRPMSIRVVDCEKYPWYYRSKLKINVETCREKVNYQKINENVNFKILAKSSNETERASDERSRCQSMNLLSKGEDSTTVEVDNRQGQVSTKNKVSEYEHVKLSDRNNMAEARAQLNNNSDIDFKKNRGLIGIKIKYPVGSESSPFSSRSQIYGEIQKGQNIIDINSNLSSYNKDKRKETKIYNKVTPACTKPGKAGGDRKSRKKNVCTRKIETNIEKGTNARTKEISVLNNTNNDSLILHERKSILTKLKSKTKNATSNTPYIESAGNISSQKIKCTEGVEASKNPIISFTCTKNNNKKITNSEKECLSNGNICINPINKLLNENHVNQNQICSKNVPLELKKKTCNRHSNLNKLLAYRQDQEQTIPRNEQNISTRNTIDFHKISTPQSPNNNTANIDYARCVNYRHFSNAGGISDTQVNSNKIITSNSYNPPFQNGVTYKKVNLSLNKRKVLQSSITPPLNSVGIVSHVINPTQGHFRLPPPSNILLQSIKKVPYFQYPNVNQINSLYIPAGPTRIYFPRSANIGYSNTATFNTMSNGTSSNLYLTIGPRTQNDLQNVLIVPEVLRPKPDSQIRGYSPAILPIPSYRRIFQHLSKTDTLNNSQRVLENKEIGLLKSKSGNDMGSVTKEAPPRKRKVQVTYVTGDNVKKKITLNQ